VESGGASREARAAFSLFHWQGRLCHGNRIGKKTKGRGWSDRGVVAPDAPAVNFTLELHRFNGRVLLSSADDVRGPIRDDASTTIRGYANGDDRPSRRHRALLVRYANRDDF
jgi:hypothetical protein